MPELSKYSKNELCDLVNDGIAPCHLITHYEVIEFINNECSSSVSKTQAVSNCANQFNMSEDNVWRILRENN